MSGNPVPYRWIAGLPPEAQKQIERNFLEVQKQLGATSASLFDAQIDPGLSASAPASHQYKNLTDLVANESLSSTKMFSVAMINRPGTPVAETGNITVPGLLAITAIAPGTGRWSDNSRARWDLKGFTVTNATHTVLTGIEVENTGAAITAVITGTVYASNCRIQGQTGGVQKITQLCTSLLTAVNTEFEVIQFASETFLFDCLLEWDASTGSNLNNASDLYWIGGHINVLVGGGTLTFNGTGRSVLLSGLTYEAPIEGSTSSATLTLAFINTGTNYLEMRGANAGTGGLPVTVSTAAGNTVIRGDMASVLFSTNSSNKQRVFDGNVALASDFSGPCDLNMRVLGGVTVTLRGSAVSARISGTSQGTPNPLVSCVSLLDSLVLLAAIGGGTGKPYAIDIGSARVILIVAGSNTSWGSAGTNASVTSLVINETGILSGSTIDTTAIHRDGLWFTPALILGGM